MALVEKQEEVKKKSSWVDKHIFPRTAAPFILTIGDRRQGKTALSTRIMEDFLIKVKNEDGEADGIVIFLGSPSVPKFFPRKFRDRIKVTTELFNDYIFEGGDIPKLFIQDEAIIFSNNKDWQDDTTRLFEKYSVVSGHFACRTIFNVQTLKFLTALIQLVDYRFYKKCNSELIQALKTGSNRQQFVKDYDWYIKRCPKDIVIIDDKETSLEEGFERPKMFRFKLPSFWSDRLSKSWSTVTKKEFMEIVNPRQIEQLRLDDMYNALITYVHVAEHVIKRQNVTQDNSLGVLTAATNINISKHKVRITLPKIRSLLSMHGCPLCDKKSAYWTNAEFEDMSDKVIPAINWLTPEEKQQLLNDKKTKEVIEDVLSSSQ